MGRGGQDGLADRLSATRIRNSYFSNLVESFLKDADGHKPGDLPQDHLLPTPVRDFLAVFTGPSLALVATAAERLAKRCVSSGSIEEVGTMSGGTTWYVVADGGKARILTLDGGKMHTLESFDRSGHGDTAKDSSAGVSQLKAPKSDPHDQSKVHFAKQVAARLNEAVRTGKVDEIVLAAPAHVLHDIRDALDKAASARLGKTLSKDLANTPDIELTSHFS